MQYQEKLKKAPNLRSIKVIDIEIEKLFQSFIGEPNFMFLLNEDSNFYIEPHHSPKFNPGDIRKFLL